MLKSLGATGLLLAGGATTAAARPGGVAAGDARFRVGHFSPDAPPVDVYVNGDPFPGLQGVPFGVLSDYFTVPAGTYQVEVTPAGDASTVKGEPAMGLPAKGTWTRKSPGLPNGT